MSISSIVVKERRFKFNARRCVPHELRKSFSPTCTAIISSGCRDFSVLSPRVLRRCPSFSTVRWGWENSLRRPCVSLTRIFHSDTKSSNSFRTAKTPSTKRCFARAWRDKHPTTDFDASLSETIDGIIWSPTKITVPSTRSPSNIESLPTGQWRSRRLLWCSIRLV